MFGDEVTLDAEPAAGYRFDAWGGDCTDRDDPCTLTMDADRTASAAFVEERTVTVTVSEGGTVTSDPGGIDCTADTCSEGFAADGDPVVLTAAPGLNTTLQWGGACADAEGNSCTLTLEENRTVEASFNLPEPERGLRRMLVGRSSSRGSASPGSVGQRSIEPTRARLSDADVAWPQSQGRRRAATACSARSPGSHRIAGCPRRGR